MTQTVQLLVAVLHFVVEFVGNILSVDQRLFHLQDLCSQIRVLFVKLLNLSVNDFPLNSQMVGLVLGRHFSSDSSYLFSHQFVIDAVGVAAFGYYGDRYGDPGFQNFLRLLNVYVL